MSTTTRHISIGEGESWTETTEGQTPNSIAVSTNAKGQAQVDVKLVYASTPEMAARVAEDLIVILKEVKRALAALNIPLAGEGK